MLTYQDLGFQKPATATINHFQGTRRRDPHGATRIVKRLAKQAGIDKQISPYSLRHSFITAARDAGVALRDVCARVAVWVISS